MEIAMMAYQGGKFEYAKERYAYAVQNCSDNYEARLGLANSCREYGTELYKVANVQFENDRPDQAKKTFQDANENHALAEQLFRTAVGENPDDVQPHYGLGMLWYQRSTSPITAPWPLNDTLHRQAERDRSIGEFTFVYNKMPELVQVRRYLGLLQLAAGKKDDAFIHLKFFHDSMQSTYDQVVAQPATTDEEKKAKGERLGAIEKEINDIRDLIMIANSNLQYEREKLKAKPARTPAEEARLAEIARDQLILEGEIRRFSLIQLSPSEMQVVNRCRDYLDSFKRGVAEDVLSYMNPSVAGEAGFQQSVREKVSLRPLFRNIRFTNVEISGDRATVSLLCEVETGRDKKPHTEITLRWRLAGGQWLAVDLP
jgi:hypothetical protein